MARRRFSSAVAAWLVALLCFGVAPAGAAITIGIGTPTLALANFGPGRTASGTGGITITAVLTPWTLSVADTTGHAGKLARAGVGCSGSEALTANPLSVSV